jgi:hypothetical protein
MWKTADGDERDVPGTNDEIEETLYVNAVIKLGCNELKDLEFHDASNAPPCVLELELDM